MYQHPCQPCCAALVCSTVLLTFFAHVARLQSYNGTVFDDYEGEGVGVPGGDLSFHEAATLAMNLWAHRQVAECLDSGPTVLDPKGWFHHNALKLNQAENEKKNGLVQKVWELELNQYRQGIVRNSLFQSIKSRVLAMIRSEQSGKDGDVGEKHIVGLKGTLVTQFHFDYDSIKRNCMLDLELRVNRTKDMVEDELSSGCTGVCSRRSLVSSGQCRETSGTSFCPEGTRCGCSFRRNEVLGALVGTMAAATYAGAAALAAGPVAGLAIPGKVEVGMLTAVLSSSRAEGCRCLPAPCKWSAARGACAPAPAAAGASRNPHQALLPYVGMKCTARPPSAWRAAVDLEPACEAAQPCMPQDAGMQGQVGSSTFNCKYAEATPPLGSKLLRSVAGGLPPLKEALTPASTLFPPLSERLASYSELYGEQY